MNAHNRNRISPQSPIPKEVGMPLSLLPTLPISHPSLSKGDKENEMFSIVNPGPKIIKFQRYKINSNV